MFKNLSRLILLSLVLLTGIKSNASHLMGGEITWECLPSGRFVFTVLVYRNCKQGAAGLSTTGQSMTLHNGPSSTSHNLTWVSTIDITPTCYDPTLQVACGGAEDGAIEEYKFRSQPIQINGVPPATGVWATWELCCRNAGIDNLANSNSEGFTLRAGMFPYNAQPLFPCYDNSPEFLEKPSAVLCVGYPFTYNNNGTDAEYDSLSYSWTQPLDDWNSGTFNPGVNPPSVTFNTGAGYSFNNPLPQPMHDPRNEAAVIDPITGNISYTSYTQGAYVSCVKAEAFRCGIKIAEVNRDIQVVLKGGCPANNPPDVNAPFQDPNTGLYTRYADTVYAGQTVRFTIAGTDFDFLPNGSPQEMTILATGKQFGAGYTDPNTGCDQPPCATLNPPPPVSANVGVQTDFEWATDCANLAFNTGCGASSNTYSFVIRVKDDACPAPAIQFSTIYITVLTLPVDPPKMRCLTPVNNDQDLRLNWEPPIDTGGFFDSYHLFHGPTFNGPFTLVDSIFDINTDQIIIPGVTSGYFFIRSRNNCGVLTKSSDTVGVMELTAVNPQNEVGNLTWTTFSDQFSTSSFQEYQIRREFPPGNWEVIASVQDTFYNDTMLLCDDFVNYQIAVVDSSGCANFSTIKTLHYEDAAPPAVSSMVRVTVDHATNNAVLDYSESVTPDAIAYIIYRNFTGNFMAIDTVWDITQTTYTYEFSLADQEAEQYRVAVLDSCYNVSPLNVEHATIHMARNLEPCDGVNQLSWSNYINWRSGVNSYSVYVSEDGGPYTLLGTTAPGTFSMDHNNLQRNSVYCYYVEAVDNDGLLMSQSNLDCAPAGLPKPPDYDYMEAVSVNHEEEFVSVRNLVDSTASVVEYRIERSQGNANNYEIIGFVPAGKAIIEYDDQTADFEKYSYFYRAIAVDSCGMDADTSNLGRTIKVQAEAASDMTNRVQWNPYANWDAGVDRYELYRSVGGEWEATPIAVYPADSAFSYVDMVGDYSESSGKFCYRIVAYEKTGNTFNVVGESYSNDACARQEPRVFIPNSFTPDGKNPIFKPSNAFTDSQYYEFSIIDRWGKEMFYTTDPQEGWDGKDSQGRDVPMGVYVYRMRSQTLFGTEILKHGTVTLIR